jgi:hypothetical protein
VRLLGFRCWRHAAERRQQRPLPPLVVTHLNRSTVILHNRATDGKANAPAVLLGAVKRLKYFLGVRHSGTIVADFDDYAFIRALRANVQSLVGAVRILHRFRAVAYEIH